MLTTSNNCYVLCAEVVSQIEKNADRLRTIIRIYFFIFVLFLLLREIWTNDLFGKNEMEPEEEFMCFYDIFRLDLPGTVM